MNQIDKEKKNLKGDYTIKLKNNYEINFIIKIYKDEILNQNNISHISIKDRIKFFSEKAKESENQKYYNSSKKKNPIDNQNKSVIESNDKNQNNKIRNSCFINKSFLEEINKNINKQKIREQNSIKNNNQKELNKKINKIEINAKKDINNNEDSNRSYTLQINDWENINDNDNRSYSIQAPNKKIGNANDNGENRKFSIQTKYNQDKNDKDNNKTNNKLRVFGGKISNFIKDKLNIKNNKNSNINNSQIIHSKKEILSNQQTKEQKVLLETPKKITKNQSPFNKQNSKEFNKSLIKSASSSNFKVNNNLKNKLPKLSEQQIEEIKIIDDTQSTSISSNRSSVTELTLDAINYDTFLEMQNKKKKDNQIKDKKGNRNKDFNERETFCEGFFITSFPKKNGQVIENSYSFRAPCGHFKCSKLPAMKPEIIMRYPLKDTKNLDINNLAASICFPTGIKVCYFENNPSIMRDYVTPITNQKGERYYMMTYHFFLKITNSEFTKIYEQNPLKHHLRKFGEAYINLRGDELTKEIVDEIQESLKYCEELGFVDFVYIPYCICLISKYPFIHEMEKCLQSIYYLMIEQMNNFRIINDNDKIELNKLIMFLVHSVPIPNSRNSKLKFYIPYFNNGIEITCPKLNDINIININISVLLKWFSINNIIIILRLILFEKKLLFVDDNYERLSNIIDIFISLIYPFQWIHTYIPIMSEEMINYIETFLPFVNGIHNSLFPLIKKLVKEDAIENETISNDSNESENDDVFYLIYITENKIGLSSEFKNNFRNVSKYIEENIPHLPPVLEKDLYNKLLKIKDEINLFTNINANNNYKNNLNKNKSKDLSKFDIKLRNIFIELFVEMFDNFYKYLCILDNNDVVFNKKLFIKSKQIKDQKFYEDFVDTQIFQQFIQSFMVDDNYYFFKTMLATNKNYIRFSSINFINKNNLKNEFYYYVIPDCFDVNNNDIKNIEKTLKKECNINEIKINENGILPNTQRILTSIEFIDEKKYNNKNCLIYLFPQCKDNNNYNDKKMEKLNTDFLKKFENYKSNSDTINEIDEIESSSKKIKINLNQNSYIISDKEKDNLEEYIKDFSIKLFSSEKINIYNPRLKTEIQNSITNAYGRKYFINILYQNIKNNNVVLLEYSYFNFLGTLIYNLILSTLKVEETDEILEQIIYLIKSTNYFGKKEYTKHGVNVITLYDIYKPKIQVNTKVYQFNFWRKWYEIEIRNIENNNDEQIQEIFYQICDSMINLELPKSFIKNVLQGLIDKAFGKENDTNKNTFNLVIKKIINAKYISQVRI